MRKINIVTSVAFASLLMSCKTFPDILELGHAKSQEEAGSVNIAMMPLIPWDDIAQKLQPNFAMKTADEALAMVLPVTQSEDYRRSRKFGAGLGVNLAGSSTSKLSEFTQSEVFGNNPSITALENTSISRAFEPGTRPDVSATLPGGSLMADQILNAFAPNMDPFLQYRSATALYQEVKILNQYLQGVDEFRGYTPFLARVQLTINPYKKNLPYDVYTTIQFATQDEKSNLKVIPLVISDNLERSDQRRMAEAVSQLGLNISAMVAGTGVGGDLKSQIESLKNLAGRDYNSTKSLSKIDESTLLVRTGAAYAGSSEVSMTPRSYDITFLLMLLDEDANSNKPVTLTTSDGNFLKNNMGKNINSLEDMFKLPDSEITNKIRQIPAATLKAAYNADINYNDPNKWTLEVFALPEFRDSTTGKPLPVWGRVKFVQARLLKNEKIKNLNTTSEGGDKPLYSKIENKFASLGQSDLEKIIETLGTSDPHLKSDIDRLFKLKYGAYDEIDVFKMPPTFSENTHVNFKDDGKTALTVVLPPSKGLSQKRLEASLEVTIPPKQKFKKTKIVKACPSSLPTTSRCIKSTPSTPSTPSTAETINGVLQYEDKYVIIQDKKFKFSANSIALDSAGRVKLEFPSLVALNLGGFNLSAATYKLDLNYIKTRFPTLSKEPSPTYTLVKNTAASVKPKAKDWFKFDALIKTVTAKDAQGKIYLSVETKQEETKPGVKQTVPVIVSVKNAILGDVKAMQGQTIAPENLKLVREKNAFIISQTAGVVIDVSQLVKDSEVEITATAVKLDKKGKAKPKPGSATPKVVKVKIVVPTSQPKKSPPKPKKS